MDVSQIKDDILLAFKLNGLSLRSDATSYLLSHLASADGADDARRQVDKIISSVHKLGLDSACVTRKILEAAINGCEQEREGENQTFSVLSAFQMPKVDYDARHKRFTEIRSSGRDDLRLFGTPEDKAKIFLERYQIVHQRLLRHEVFAPFQDGSNRTVSRKYQLMTIEDLLASSDGVDAVVTFGMLVQLSEEKFYLEDPAGVVQLVLAGAEFQDGLYTENCLCIVEGSFRDNLLTATAVGLAPIELATSTYSHYFINASADLQTSSSFQSKFNTKLALLERERNDATVLFLSDVWLDSTTVLERVRTVIDGFADSPPVAIVLMGDFLSKPYGAEEEKILKDGFKKLANIILCSPLVAQQSHFVFVPSLRDPSLTSILPKPPLPDTVTQQFSSKISNCHFGTNPCRLQYCTQDIIVFREDIVEKMCRNCVRAPVTKEKGLEHQFAKTILSQSHLTPLPLTVSPVYWPYDYTLRLYPVPDVVVCADKYKSYTELISGCVVTNPGSLGRNGSFQVYFPERRQIEDSEV